MNKKLLKSKKFIYLGALVFIVLFSVGYSALSQSLDIIGSMRYNVKYPVRVTGITLTGTSNGGQEDFSPTYNYNRTTVGATIPNSDSTVTYTVTIRNYSNQNKIMTISTIQLMDAIKVEFSDLPSNNIIPANSIVQITLSVVHRDSIYQDLTSGTRTTTYTFSDEASMFLSGRTINAKMKQFVNANATYETADSTIKYIARYKGTPNSSYLVDAYKVSTDDSTLPIYMWYESTEKTVYWYSEATYVYYNYNAQEMFFNLTKLDYIFDMNDISSSLTTNMIGMFEYSGMYEIDLGSRFDTSNVVDMDEMFYGLPNLTTIYATSSFVVSSEAANNMVDTTMMFEDSLKLVGGNGWNYLDGGYWYATIDTQNDPGYFTERTFEGAKFKSSYYVNSRIKSLISLTNDYTSTDSTITNIARYTGTPSSSVLIDRNIVSTDGSTIPIYMWYDSTNTTIYWYTTANYVYYGMIGDYFFADLRNVNAISNLNDIKGDYLWSTKYMFYYTGYSSTSFALALGTNFDTSNVTNMSNMFAYTGYNSLSFTLDLGTHFNTWQVRDMSGMFQNCGRVSTVVTFDLGDQFDTSLVDDMSYMFSGAAYESPVFTLDLGEQFDTSNVEDMSYMFNGVGYSSYFFELDLGELFDTSNVTNMSRMFRKYSGRILDISILDTSSVTDMGRMFAESPNLVTIYVSTSFVTTSVTTHANMFIDCPNIVGQKGTVYNSSYVDKARAKIDGGTSSPGYFTEKKVAIFKTGQEVNARMKQFVTSGATYSTTDTTITNIQRYTGTSVNNGNLVDANRVSTSDSPYPIFMWYSGTTIYWYTQATRVFYNADSSDFYYNLKKLNSISNLSDISSKNVTNMSEMFSGAGASSTSFVLDVGTDFDTGNVTNMYAMFAQTGMGSTSFTLNLGNKFDTSNVVNMQYMFYFTGQNSTAFTLDLGDRFDTSSVTNMYGMFDLTGEGCGVFTLDLGDKFDTSSVTTMREMFQSTGYSNTSFTLDLGDKFDTSSVTDMGYMFTNVGYLSTSFTLDLGSHFDTSSVTNMEYMFYCAGYSSTAFTLNLGSLFDTSSVTTMEKMFGYIGYSTSNFVLDLKSSFDTSSVTNMNSMFRSSRYLKTIYAPTSFVTTAVTNSLTMFTGCTNLVGGMGTAYNSSNTTATYAHIDGGTLDPGYFTDRNVTRTIYWGYNSRNNILTLSNSAIALATVSGTTNGVFNSASDVPWASYASSIYQVNISNNITPTSLAYFFSGLNKLRILNNLERLDTSRVISFEESFSGVTSMGGADFTNMDTSNATNMQGMFKNCNMPVLDITSFDTSNVTDMSNMFASSNFRQIYASNTFVTSSVTNSANMFTGNGNLSGDAGTSYNSSNVTHTYAHIDGGTSNPGYFRAGPVNYSTVIISTSDATGNFPMHSCSSSELAPYGLSGFYSCFTVPIGSWMTLSPGLDLTGSSCVKSFNSMITYNSTVNKINYLNPSFLKPNIGHEKNETRFMSGVEQINGYTFTPTREHHYLLDFTTGLCDSPTGDPTV